MEKKKNRCWFFHDWKIEATSSKKLLGDYFTHLLYRCQTCDKMKVETIEGSWILRSERLQRENQEMHKEIVEIMKQVN